MTLLSSSSSSHSFHTIQSLFTPIQHLAMTSNNVGPIHPIPYFHFQPYIHQIHRTHPMAYPKADQEVHQQQQVA